MRVRPAERIAPSEALLIFSFTKAAAATPFVKTTVSVGLVGWVGLVLFSFSFFYFLFL